MYYNATRTVKSALAQTKTNHHPSMYSQFATQNKAMSTDYISWL